jgi:hypothetical protein
LDSVISGVGDDDVALLVDSHSVRAGERSIVGALQKTIYYSGRLYAFVETYQLSFYKCDKLSLELTRGGQHQIREDLRVYFYGRFKVTKTLTFTKQDFLRFVKYRHLTLFPNDLFRINSKACNKARFGRLIDKP